MLLALALAQGMPAVDPAADAEVLVIGERLKRWAGKLSDTAGIRRCRTTRSTGDVEIDRIGCRVMTDCFVPMKARFTAAQTAAGRDAERRRLALAPLHAELVSCAQARRTALIIELRTRRQAGASPTP